MKLEVDVGSAPLCHSERKVMLIGESWWGDTEPLKYAMRNFMARGRPGLQRSPNPPANLDARASATPAWFVARAPVAGNARRHDAVIMD